MAARNVNLVIEQNVDFEATFTIRNANNSPLNLTGYSALAKIRKHPDATKYTDFVISFPNRINGVVKVALAVTSTAMCMIWCSFLQTIIRLDLSQEMF